MAVADEVVALFPVSASQPITALSPPGAGAEPTSGGSLTPSLLLDPFTLGYAMEYVTACGHVVVCAKLISTQIWISYSKEILKHITEADYLESTHWTQYLYADLAPTAQQGLTFEFLPSAMLYMSYRDASGSAVYTINDRHGEEGHWSVPAPADRAIAAATDTGLAQKQMVRLHWGAKR